MTTTPLDHTDVLVLDYLAALWACSDDLSAELRDELMSTVADYVAARRAALVGATGPAEIIRCLGSPESLVDAARRGGMPVHLRLPALVAPPAQAPAGAAGTAEYTAVGLLTAGAFLLPVAGPAAGMLLVTGSPRWTRAQKATGWIMTAGTTAGGFMLILLLAVLGFPIEPAAVLVYLVACVGPWLAGATLVGGLRRPAG